MIKQSHHALAILRLPRVKEITGLSRTAIYDKLSRSEFPRPISLGSRSIGWLESEVNDWIAEQVEKSRRDVGARK